MAIPQKFYNSSVNDYAKDKHVLSFTGVHVGIGVNFYAYLTAFSQNFASTWSSEQVYGRNDPIGTFQGTQRTITLGWDVPAGNLLEAQANLRKFGTLSKLLYPSYDSPEKIFSNDDGDIVVSSNALSLSKSPLMRIKYANLISTEDGDGLLGWIGNLSWIPVIEMGVFETKDKIYPKVASLSIDFTAQHERDLGWDGRRFMGKSSFPFKG